MQLDDLSMEDITIKLYHYCSSLTSSKWEAEDLVQETLIKYIKLKQVDPDREMNLSFLYTMARNLLIDDKRKRKEVFTNQPELIGLVDHVPEWDSLLEILCSTLPIHQAMLITLKDVFQYTSQEIADMLRVSNESIKTSLHRSRRKLLDDQSKIQVNSLKNDSLRLKKFFEAVKKEEPYSIFKYYRLLEAKNYKLSRNRYSLFIIDPDGNVLQFKS